jgi:hypothetical protein
MKCATIVGALSVLVLFAAGMFPPTAAEGG